MVSTVTTARCNAPACPWEPAGDPDKAAERHRKATGHTVVTKTVPR